MAVGGIPKTAIESIQQVERSFSVEDPNEGYGRSPLSAQSDNGKEREDSRKEIPIGGRIREARIQHFCGHARNEKRHADVPGAVEKQKWLEGLRPPVRASRTTLRRGHTRANS